MLLILPRGQTTSARDVARRRFIDRRRERAALQEAWASGIPQLVVMTGRRRVGKTALLSRFASGKAVAYYAAARQLKRVQLADLGRVLGPLSTGFGRGRPPRLSLADWEDVLETVSDAAQRRRVGLVLDEFPYLAEADPALPSVIQRWWDRTGTRRNLMLVLAGSHQTMMQQLVSYDGALHERPTLRLALEPLDYFQASKFTPTWGPDDRIRAYAVAGGMPAYLELFDDRRSLRDELLRLAYTPQGPFFHAAPSLLASEFTEPRTYETILRAIAAGETTPSRIAQLAGLSGANAAAPYLDRLLSLGYVVRHVLPLDATAPRPRISRYQVADHHLRFYFRLIDPWRSQIQVGRGEEVLDELMAEDFDRHVSLVFEEVARHYLLLDRSRGLPPLSHVGPWWGDATDIDVVGVSRSTVVAAGEAKWSRSYVKPGDLAELRTNVAQMSPGSKPRLYLFSRSGFDPHLAAEPDVVRISLRDLYRSDVDLDARVGGGSR